MTPASGLKKSKKVHYTHSTKKELFRDQDCSVNQYKDTSVEKSKSSIRKKSFIAYVFDQVDCKRSKLTGTKTALKKSKKLKLDKSKIRKCSTKRKRFGKPKKSLRDGASLKRKDLFGFDSRTNHTFDVDVQKIVDITVPKMSKYDLMHEIQCLNTKTSSKVYSKNMKTILNGCKAAASRLSKPKEKKSRNDTEPNGICNGWMYDKDLSKYVKTKSKSKTKCESSAHKASIIDYQKMYEKLVGSKLVMRKESAPSTYTQNASFKRKQTTVL